MQLNPLYVVNLVKCEVKVHLTAPHVWLHERQYTNLTAAASIGGTPNKVSYFISS